MPSLRRALSLTCVGVSERTLGRIARAPVPDDERHDTFLVLPGDAPTPSVEHLEEYGAVILGKGVCRGANWPAGLPSVQGLESLEDLPADAVVAVDPRGGILQLLYRPDSPHNTLFATNRCNSRCVMCPQPPTVSDDGWLLGENLRLLELIRLAPVSIGITGGEPTLLGAGLVRLVATLNERFPKTCVYLLTNGRLFAYWDYAAALAGIGHCNLLIEVPLYADIAEHHDAIVAAPGAFDQTLAGLYNLTRLEQSIRLRVVLGRETVPRLVKLMEFIYRNLPFVTEVALMGMEPMGYVKKRWNQVWMDPVDYAPILESAVRHAVLRGLAISIFNIPRCLLPRSLWPFARQSISDHKSIFLPVCEGCVERSVCSGLFASEVNRHSRAIRAIENVANPL